MKVALNVPVAVDVMVEGEVVCVVPSYLMVMVCDAAKPVPDTVIVPPTIPLDGFKTMEAETLNVAEPVWRDTSVAATMCAPLVEIGTENVALNEPIVDEATVVGEVV